MILVYFVDQNENFDALFHILYCCFCSLVINTDVSNRFMSTSQEYFLRGANGNEAVLLRQFAAGVYMIFSI